MSPAPSTTPRTEAEQIVYLTRELQRAELKIQALEERLRQEMIRKYGPKSEKLNDAQLLLLDMEPGVSDAEVEAESFGQWRSLAAQLIHGQDRHRSAPVVKAAAACVPVHQPDE